MDDMKNIFNYRYLNINEYDKSESVELGNPMNHSRGEQNAGTVI